MDKYIIKIILLKGCYYSNLAKQLLLNNNLPCKIIEVDYENKNLYKTDKIQTYPQIYLIKKNSIGNLLLGGCNDLEFIIKTFKNVEYNINNVNNFIEKYKWSKKATLRLIELINKK